MLAKWPPTETLPTVAPRLRKILLTAAELGVILAWSVYLVRDYLAHMGTQFVPSGREFGSLIASHHFWTRVQQCGLCALWNGDQGGGYPALAEAVGAPFHPLVAAATLVFGVVDGAKVTVLVALFLGGLAGWWLAHSLDLGTAARLWAGLLGAGGGYISARMELGALTLAFSTAACALLIPAAVHLWRRQTPQAALLFSLVLASAILSGQGYVQIGVLLTLPSYLVLAAEGKARRTLLLFAVAGLLAAALTAFYLVPTLRFTPIITKWSDPQFAASQPLEYVPLNLVIRDIKFYLSEALGKLPYPHMNANYIGWPAVALAALTLRFARREHRLPLLFLAANAAFGMLAVSGVIPRLIVAIFPDFAMARFIVASTGIITPPIIGLSAYGLDCLLRLRWPEIAIGFSKNEGQNLVHWDLRYLLLIPLFWNLWTLDQFARNWLVTVKLGNDVQQVIQALRTPTTQWVATPFGEQYFVEPAVAQGLHLSPGVLNFNWKDRDRPLPFLEAARKGQPQGTAFERRIVDEISLYSRPSAQFAYVQTTTSTVPCAAQALGGHVDVTCTTPEEGSLLVSMNRWSGWQAWVDGQPVPLVDSRWLVVRAPAGTHTYSFRYLPWDVTLGAVISVAGMVLALLWLRGFRLPFLRRIVH